MAMYGSRTGLAPVFYPNVLLLSLCLAYTTPHSSPHPCIYNTKDEALAMRRLDDQQEIFPNRPDEEA
jgi:hypothetical protein